MTFKGAEIKLLFSLYMNNIHVNIYIYLNNYFREKQVHQCEIPFFPS